ncbi:GlcG/HbpS family heme-binding protein (plasmid) [Ralstonia sp. 25C]|uniref:GlcG/HbpS family heme-binding protein n=1 Tax=Ralstonia sp. 25C TaxID=3447363 RepID=UPI003F750C56
MNAPAITPSRQTVASSNITRDAALALIDAARTACRVIGIEVTIAITDAAGHLKAFERSDKAAFLTADVATDKAWTAASFGLATQTWNEILDNGQVAQLAHRPRLVAVGGGYPIILNGEVVGGIGISGGTTQQDHDACIVALKSQGFELR